MNSRSDERWAPAGRRPYAAAVAELAIASATGISLRPVLQNNLPSLTGTIAATGEECASGFRLRMADGSYRYFAGRLSRMQDKRGRVVKWAGAGSARDAQQVANL